MKTMNIMKHSCLNTAICVLSLLALVSCDKDAHENEYPLPAGQGGIIVGLQTEMPQTGVESLTLYLFDSDGTVARRKAYTDPRTLASEHIPAPAGSYTPVVVANADPASLPQQTTPADLTQWLKERIAQYPDLLTASAQTEIRTGEITRILMTLKQGTDGIALIPVRLLLTVPGKDLPPVRSRAASSADETRTLRCVAEVFMKGTENRIHRREMQCERQADGRYLAELSLLPGEYDLRLWTDWTDAGTASGKYYTAADLHHVTVRTDPYTAGAETDDKDAYYAVQCLSVGEAVQDEPITFIRPLARYRLVATDVEAYGKLVEKENYPPIERLTVRIIYEGFFPTGFDVATSKPNDALDTRISYTDTPTEAKGYAPAKALQVGSDFVLTNGTESFVTVTVEMTDAATGEVVNRSTGIRIPYRRGHLTTVSGHLLTAGKTSGGVQIDTEWGDEIIVEF